MIGRFYSGKVTLNVLF